MAAQKGQLFPIAIVMYGETANFKLAYLMTHICYPFEIYLSYLNYCHLPIEQIQVSRGNCNSKGFNMKEIYWLSTNISCRPQVYPKLSIGIKSHFLDTYYIDQKEVHGPVPQVYVLTLIWQVTVDMTKTPRMNLKPQTGYRSELIAAWWPSCKAQYLVDMELKSSHQSIS